MTIYYDSKTGNVERFIEKVRLLTKWSFVKIHDDIPVTEVGHLITFTTQIGKAPLSTLKFMEQWHPYIVSVSASGNMNWGNNFALAANTISQEYKIPILLKFELAGLDRDVNSFIQKVTDYANKEMDTPQQ